MENLNKALTDLLALLKEINKQTEEVLRTAEEIQKMYAEDNEDDVLGVGDELGNNGEPEINGENNTID